MPNRFATDSPRLFMQPANWEGGGHYRIIQPASLLDHHGFAATHVQLSPPRENALKTLNPDVVVLQLLLTEYHRERVQMYRKALPYAVFVYEIDDLCWAVPEDSFHYGNRRLRASKANIHAIANMCDIITVTTAELADEMRELTGSEDIRVIPNYIPRSFIDAALAGRHGAETRRKYRVGWAGALGHEGDLKIVVPIMEALGETVEWVFLGISPRGVMPGHNVEIHRAVPFRDYARKLGALNLDLALAPLEDNDFNRCKSELRVLEFAAAGYPVIASDVAPYRRCPVTRLPYQPSAWIDAIRNAMAHRDSMGAYAERLHAWVKSEKLMEDHLGEYIESYLPKNVTRFTPIAGNPPGQLPPYMASVASPSPWSGSASDRDILAFAENTNRQR